MTASTTPTATAATSLGRRSLRGGLIAAGGAWARFAIQFVTVVVVARMLGPEEYGIAAVVLVFTTLAELLRTSGIVNAVIQRDDLTPQRTATVHLVSIGVGAVAGLLGATIYAAAGGRADFAVLFALVVVASSIGAIPGALLVRRLRTLPLVAAELVAALVGCAAAIGIASAGLGGAALVWQAALYAVLTTALVLVAARWHRTSRAPLADVRPYLSFGGHSALTQASRFASQNADRLMLTTTATAADAGLYVQANQLVALPLAQITGPLHRVVLPALSRLRDDAERFRSCFRAAAATMSLTLFPLFALLAVIAEPLIASLFGVAWAGSAPLFQVLVLNGAAGAFIYLSSWVFVATGRARTQSRLTVATSAAIVAAVFVGSLWGPTGIAVALVVTNLGAAVPTFLLARRGTSLEMRDLVGPMLPGAGVAVVVAIAVFATRMLVPATPLTTLIAGLGAAAVAYILGIALIPAARRRVRALIDHGRSRPDARSPRQKETT